MHHLQVLTAALRAYKLPLLGHLNEDHVVPELQFQERLHRLMLASETMHSERSFATRSGVANGLCGLAARHSRRIAAGLSQFLIRGGGWAKGLQENLVLDKFREQLCRIVISHLR